VLKGKKRKLLQHVPSRVFNGRRRIIKQVHVRAHVKFRLKKFRLDEYFLRN